MFTIVTLLLIPAFRIGVLCSFTSAHGKLSMQFLQCYRKIVLTYIRVQDLMCISQARSYQCHTYNAMLKVN